MTLLTYAGELALDSRMVAQVFPQLYLPVMAESYKRSLRPWRMYLPTQSWFQYRRRMAELDSYVKGRLRERWSQRQQGLRTGERQDIADLLMSSTEAAPPAVTIHICVATTASHCQPSAKGSKLVGIPNGE